MPKYKEPHERINGPWNDWELDEAGRHLEYAHKIGGHTKFLEAIKKRQERHAEEHHQIARHAARIWRSPVVFRRKP